LPKNAFVVTKTHLFLFQAPFFQFSKKMKSWKDLKNEETKETKKQNQKHAYATKTTLLFH